MNSQNMVVLDRKGLVDKIQTRSLKYIWLSNQVGVSEKTLTRWVNGDVKRIRFSNLVNLAQALNCSKEELIATSEFDVISTDKDRALLARELTNDSLLYELLIGNKLKLAISLMKSTLHSALPSQIIVSFLVKLGYAVLLRRNYSSARKYFEKARLLAVRKGQLGAQFSATVALALNDFFEAKFERCNKHLLWCEEHYDFAQEDRPQFYNTRAMYYLCTGEIEESIESADRCIEVCESLSCSLIKNVFLASAWYLRGAGYLLKDELSEARKSCVTSLNVAESSGYSRCIATSKAYLACVEATSGYRDISEALIRESLALVSEKDVSYPSLLCINLYVSRLAGQNSDAEESGMKLVEIAPNRCVTVAFTFYQLALLERDKGNQFKSVRFLNKSQDILNELGLGGWQYLFHNQTKRGTTPLRFAAMN